MRVFKNRWFAKFAIKERISDALLCAAVREAEAGLVDADYGGGVIKKRIAREGAGKSGGYRTVILYRRGNRAFFVYGFPKSETANIEISEEKAFKSMSDFVFSLSETVLAGFIEKGTY
ncbi:MAG: type II toxin-antitoxin system RelE/ParE family toxin [Magnetococcales bacterium]|nr:type II toxin-antitoxin system RelE/ParE family toxin [Magnetococcales bacterium]